MPLHELGYIPPQEEIRIDDYGPGEVRLVELHDGSHIQLRKLERDYDPTDRMGAMHQLQWASEKHEFITGLIYYDSSRPSLAETSHLVETPLAHLSDEQLRPSPEKLEALMVALM
jgi:2-oxoglutarate ferredoxin oxidoreductase subunit beta